MIKYRVVNFHKEFHATYDDEDALQAGLDQLGKDGWEMIAYERNSDNIPICIFIKR